MKYLRFGWLMLKNMAYMFGCFVIMMLVISVAVGILYGVGYLLTLFGFSKFAAGGVVVVATIFVYASAMQTYLGYDLWEDN